MKKAYARKASEYTVKQGGYIHTFMGKRKAKRFCKFQPNAVIIRKQTIKFDK